MLGFMRKKRNSWLVILAFAVIIFVFVLGYGVAPSPDNPSKAVVASVDGTPIYYDEYSNMYNRQVEYYRATLKDQFSEEFLERLNVRGQVLNSLVERVLILHAAKDEKLRVAEVELQERILSEPVFQKDGVFDKGTYYSVLERNRLNPAMYEESLKNDLLVNKMRNSVVSKVALSSEDIKKAFYDDFRDTSYEYVKITPASFASIVTTSDAEEKKFFEKMGQEFLIPTQVRVLSAFISRGSLSAKVKVSAEAISSYYEKNKMQYTKQKEVKASHILIRPKKGDDPTAERDKARVAAEGILANARSGGNFAKLAKEHSEDPGSGQKGGDLGWFGRGMMVRLFEDSAFSLGKGKISDLVETEYGFHIIKVIDIKEAKVVSLKEATPAIRTRLLAGEAETEGRTIMATLYDVFNSGGSDDKEVARLVEEAKSRGVTAKATGLFSANTSSEEVVRNEKLKQSAFNLESGSVSGTLDTKEGFYILKILERIEPHVPPFADVAVEVRDALRGVKATEAAEKQAENILDKLKKGESFAELLKAEKLSSSTTKFFTKVSGFIPEVGAYVGDREGFFDLKPEAPYFKEVLDHRGDFYVFKLKEVREVKDALFAEKKASFGEELLSKKKQEAVVDWLDELRSSSEIIENEQYL